MTPSVTVGAALQAPTLALGRRRRSAETLLRGCERASLELAFLLQEPQKTFRFLDGHPKGLFQGKQVVIVGHHIMYQFK